MNTVTPRVFIAATRQNDGKTTASLGLIAALQQRYPRVGYIKPVGQRFIEIEEQKIDEDTVLMDAVFRLNCPLVDMSPIAVEPDFTRKYLQSSNNEALVKTIQKAFDRVAWEKDFVLCEGSGHAGVGSVFDLSNAQVAKILGAKVIIVTQGGIGKPIDEVSLNHALFAKEGVEIYYNRGGTNFQLTAALQFPPSYGTAAWQVLDFALREPEVLGWHGRRGGDREILL